MVARYYYIYAIDYDRGGEWSGKAFMCTRDKEFTIRGTEDCLARGYDRTGFFEVDTGEQRSWTVQLTETRPNSRAAAADAAARRCVDRRRRRHRRTPMTPRRTSASPEARDNETPAPHQDRRHARARLSAAPT